MSYPAISLATATVGRYRCPQKRLQTARQPPVYPNSSPRIIAPVTPSPPSAALTPSIPVHRWIRAKEPEKGAGLGLFTAHGIITHLNGHIAVSSKAGEGTTFIVYIPRVDGPYTTEEPPGEALQSPRGREKVLLVEDEQVVRDVAGSVLRAEGYTVLEASDGVQALRLVQGHECEDLDLLFTDVVMPVMSGWELANKVRECRPGIRVLYTTGYTGDAVGFASMHQNGTGFIEKPFTPAELARQVRLLLES